MLGINQGLGGIDWWQKPRGTKYRYLVPLSLGSGKLGLVPSLEVVAISKSSNLCFWSGKSSLQCMHLVATLLECHLLSWQLFHQRKINYNFNSQRSDLQCVNLVGSLLGSHLLPWQLFHQRKWILISENENPFLHTVRILLWRIDVSISRDWKLSSASGYSPWHFTYWQRKINCFLFDLCQCTHFTSLSSLYSYLWQ
jgi:hypothetical protein